MATAPPLFAAFDFSRTFLHRHIDQELVRVDDILPLAELPAATGTEQRRRLRQFFHAADSIYLPIEVYCVDDPLERYRDVAAMLAQTRTRSLAGVLLSARSGAGKTLALRKAFFDCLCAAAEAHDSEPPLAGYLPCLLKPARLGDQSGGPVLQRLIHEAAFGGPAEDRDLRRVERWLRQGPPLLLLADLNAAPPDLRHTLALELRQFQQSYAAHGHRCVLEYRGHADGDAVLEILRSDTLLFREFDLSAPTAVQIATYAQRWRAFAASAEETAGSPLAAAAQSPEVSWAAGSALLMHLATNAVRPGGREASGRWELLEQVVERHLQRDGARYAAALPAALANPLARRDLLLATMSRLALAMLARGPGHTRLEIDDVETLLAAPDDPYWRETPARNRRDWRPGDDFWQSSGRGAAYYRRAQDDPALRAEVLRFSLLRREGRQIGFLHDAFVEYFAVRALRFYASPRLPRALPAEWSAPVAARILESPHAWLPAADLLAGAMVADARESGHCPLAEVVLHLLLGAAALPSGPSAARLIAALAAHLPGEEPLLLALQRALVRHGELVEAYPAAAAQEVYHELAWRPTRAPELRAFAARLKEGLAAANRPWLRQVAGPPPAGADAMCRVLGHVDCAVLLANGRIAFAGGDRTLHLWQPRTGLLLSLHRHTTPVKRLALLSDGRLASSADEPEGLIQLVSPDDSATATALRHGNRILFLAALAAGEFLTAGVDGRIVRHDPRGGSSRCIVEHPASIAALAVSSGGRLATACDAGTLSRTAPRADHVDWQQLAASVVALAWCGESTLIVGLDDGALGAWDDGAERAETLVAGAADGEPWRLIQALAADSFLAASPLGLTLWRRAADQGPWRRAWERPDLREVRAAVLHSDAQLAVACGTRVEWLDLETGVASAPAGEGHAGLINCLLATEQGALVTAASDGSVRWWRRAARNEAGRSAATSGDEVSPLAEPSVAPELLAAPVAAAASFALPDGRRVVATPAGQVLVYGAREQLLARWQVSREPPLCLAPWSATEILVGDCDRDRHLRLWDIVSGAHRTWRETTAWTTQLAVAPGRYVAWACQWQIFVVDLARPGDVPWQFAADRSVTGLAIAPDAPLVLVELAGGERLALAIEPAWSQRSPA